MTVMPRFGWRGLLLFSAIPSGILLLTSPLVPRSARYLLSVGEKEKARAVVERIAKSSGKPMLDGELMLAVEARESSVTLREKLKVLWDPRMRKTMLLLLLLWAISSFAYYGIVLLVPLLLKNPSHHARTCVPPSAAELRGIVISASGELAGIILLGIVINRYSRRLLMGLTFLLPAIGMVAVLFVDGRTFILVLAFVMRGSLTAAFQVVYVYTPEVLPTLVRGTGMGAAEAASRMGAMAAPYASTLLGGDVLHDAIIMFAIVYVCGVLTVAALPYETRNKRMPACLDDLDSLRVSNRVRVKSDDREPLRSAA
eukprot:PLAT3802.3.p1 GENE.PLAT3802.3~~PLAT3802.3.p1  ORF type:complete len:313 (+),score=139.10 PLAT3802.3:661-1599(+)